MARSEEVQIPKDKDKNSGKPGAAGAGVTDRPGRTGAAEAGVTDRTGKPGVAGAGVTDGTGKPGGKRVSGNRMRQVFLLIAVFMLIYIPSVYNWLNNANMATDILRNGSLVESINVDAIIIRNEDVILSFTDGTFIPSRSEGEKVAANAKIATVFTRSSLELIEELNYKKRAVIESQYERVNTGTAYSKEIESIDSDIGKLVINLTPLINKNSLRQVGQASRDINSLVSKKAELFGAMPTNDAYINQLMRERDELEERITLNSSTISAPSAGYISYAIDEYASELTLASIPNINYKAYSELIERNANKSSQVAPPNDGIAVKSGDPISKIVRTNNFYFVVNVKDSQFESMFKAGDSVRIRTVNPSKEFERAEIIYTSEKTDNGTIYAFRLQKYLFDFIDKRVVNIDLIRKYKEGLKIPISSLKDFSKDKDFAYIAVLQSSTAQMKKVSILASNDEYAIVEAFDKSDRSISLYSRYIRDPINIEEGMEINERSR